MTLKSYIRKEVAEQLNINPSTVEVYVKRGLIIPDVDYPKGKGTRRRFSKRNIFEILIAQTLVKMGFTLDRVKDILFSCRLMSGTPSIKKEKLPDVLTEAQKRRVMAEDERRGRLWDLDNWGDNWDEENDAYLSIRAFDMEGGEAVFLSFVPREGGKISVDVDEGTTSVHFIKLTELRDRVASM
jgi:DNA-binding transcriptional MerR regulator